MAEQQFNPGVSLAGAVDLEALKHQVKAEPGQAGGAPAAGGYVIDTTENTLQQRRDNHEAQIELAGNGADFCDLPDPAASVGADR